MTLQARNPLLPDGIVDGFRSPDLGWAAAQAPDDVDWTFLQAGSLVFTTFWVGPAEEAQAFAQRLVGDVKAWLVSPFDFMDPPVVAVGVWNSESTGLSMVMLLSATEDLMVVGGESVEDLNALGLPSVAEKPDSLLLVGSAGNDNYPEGLVEEAERKGHCDPVLTLLRDAAEG